MDIMKSQELEKSDLDSVIASLKDCLATLESMKGHEDEESKEMTKDYGLDEMDSEEE